MKNKMIPILVSATVLVPTLTPIQTFAIDKNAVTTNGIQYAKDSADKIQSGKESAKKEQSAAGHDIQSEAYSTFDTMASGFATLQKNYGNLGSTNMSPGYKEYLNTISTNKENSALSYKLAAQKSGKYSISENGLILREEKANDLANSMFSNDEEKKNALEQSQKEKEKQNLLNENKTDKENEGDGKFGGSVVSGNAFGSQYQSTLEKDEEKIDKAQQDKNNKWNQAFGKTNEDKSKAEADAKKKFEEAKSKSEAGNKAGEAESKIITKNYDAIQKQLAAEQDKFEKEDKQYSSVKFSAKVAGFDAAKKAANPSNAKIKAKPGSLKQKKISVPKAATVNSAKKSAEYNAIKKQSNKIKADANNNSSLTGYQSKAPILGTIENIVGGVIDFFS